MNESIDIILCTFNRLNFLQHTLKKIYQRTRYPHRVWVVDNNSTDGTQRWLKIAKAQGYLHEHIFNTKNLGLAGAYTEAFKKIKSSKGGISEYIICTQDDVVPADLTPCWLERLLHLAIKYPEYGAISCRTQRIRRRDVDESKELIDSPTSLAAFNRIQKSEDIDAVGGFTNRKHWESPEIAKNMKKIKKKLAVATHLYCSDLGFMQPNKGFADGYTSYFTYSKERTNQGELQPYPDIDDNSCIPLKVNTPRDASEQEKREAYYKYWGVDTKKSNWLLEDQKLLAKYAKEGKGADVGCGKNKCHPNAIGIDVFPFKSVNILHEGHDLWMFRDEELDFVIASHALEHFPDTKTVMWEWYRVLKKGGIMAIAVPDGNTRAGSIRGSHKCVLTKEILGIIFTDVLKMKVVESIDVPNKRKGHGSILVAARK